MVARLLPYVPLIALLFWAAIVDARTRRIRNWLTLTLVVSGLFQSFSPFGTTPTVRPIDSFLGLFIGFLLPLALFLINAIGAGDVKLLAGIGAWVGALGILQVFAAEAVIGMVIVLLQAAMAGRLRLLARSTAVTAVNLLYINDLGAEHAEETARACRSIDRPLPYAVPVLAATLLEMYVTLR